MFTWKHLPKNSLPNLYVLIRGAEEIGFIYRPRSTRTERSAWRCHVGIGDSTRFIDHRWEMSEAKQLVSDSL